MNCCHVSGVTGFSGDVGIYSDKSITPKPVEREAIRSGFSVATKNASLLPSVKMSSLDEVGGAIGSLMSLVAELTAAVELLLRMKSSDDRRDEKSNSLNVSHDKKDISPVVNDSPVKPLIDKKSVAIFNEKAVGIPKDIWFGLTEGEFNNTGMVAGIKAAMMRFGQSPTEVFTSVREERGGYEVVMKDGYKAYLAREEVDKARQWADFNGADAGMVKDATFMYAVAAKREQHNRSIEIRNGGVIQYSDEPFEAAMDSLNNYFWGSKALVNLGLSDYMHEMPYSQAESEGVVGVVSVNYQSLLMTDGNVDLSGPQKLEGSVRIQRDFFGEEAGDITVHALR
ncbi:hypothetical protein [Pseudomonas canadensis]|uniref:hypothetical protein n=1 Tax=Pseudomonas canadensis TaxID=915099 RepID=UPI001F1F7F6E|nr:hypothetical protein [Pseudomonas canadensis]MCF5173149.1 hypothetical protein [Pseudomonas canadensis]